MTEPTSTRPLTLGTAGHVDHGKTTLVKALTGTDTDRLPEERRRGLTIELGFAELRLADGCSVSVVDVPGHERFVRTMVAGVSGIELYLLCVAADDSVMAQTREHWRVLQALAIDHGVVALTKCDLADSGQRERAMAEVSELVGEVPVVEVRARRGEGIERLREALAQVANEVLAARTDAQWPPPVPLLHIDRVFSIRGAGTVVTGTLSSGTLRRGERIELLPSRRTARIRTVETHGRQLERAEAGGRVALNLAGISLSEVERGDVVVASGSTVLPTYRLDVAWQGGTSPSGKDGARVQVHHGTRAVPARVFALDANGEVAQLRLERPLIACPRDRVVIRQIAPPDTLGGGVVIDPHPRRHGPRASVERLRLICRGAAEELIEAALDQHPNGIPIDPADWTHLPFVGPALGRFSRVAWHDAVRRLTDYQRVEIVGHAILPRQVARRTMTPGTHLSTEAMAALELLRKDEARPRAPQAIAEALSITRGEAVAALDELAQAGEAVRVKPGVLYARDVLSGLQARVLALLRERHSLSIAELRDELGIGRKHAQALLEHLDSQHETLRRGDRHVLRQATPSDVNLFVGRQESGGSSGLQSQ